MAEMEKNETTVDAEVATPVTEEPAVPAAKEKKVKAKAKKPNIFVRIGRRIAKFFRDYNSERKKISWKPWPEVCKSAGIVIVTVAIFSVVIWGMDQAFGSLFKWLSGLI
ncbi:MAG: preprotein translocase subunit SecE [Clostridia bacterium]|nr:preprotein translocase subunit SecE [Clostridia bacterium]